MDKIELKCACRGAFLDKFIQPSVLVTLYREPAYGSIIYRRVLELQGKSQETLDPTGFYRTLKKMETAGLLTSSWETEGGGGPTRKVFSITPRGKACLLNWQRTLKGYRRSIDRLLDEITQTLK